MDIVRSKKACTSCRARKRKCNGDLPCSYCIRIQHECLYEAEQPRRKPLRNQPPPVNDGPTQLQLLEANSAAVFVQRLAISRDIPMAPDLHCYGWNLGFGQELIFIPNVEGLTDIVSFTEMSRLATIYFAEVSPVYDFIDRQAMQEAIARRWQEPGLYEVVDSLLLGIAALGCLFDSNTRQSEMERHLVYSARVSLEYSCQLPLPDVDHVVGWLLRVIYLRMTSTPHATWMASCTLMHMIEMAKLHFDSDNDSILAMSSSSSSWSYEQRRKIFHVAQLFNTWVSLDCGKSQVELWGASPQLPQTGWTTEQLELYRLSILLAPRDYHGLEELENALQELGMLSPGHPMLQLLQCNIALCLFRRVIALGSNLSTRSLESMMDLMRMSLNVVDQLRGQDSPWWHVLNISFQISCTLMVINSEKSLDILPDALRVVRSVAMHYQTKEAKEAYEFSLSLAKQEQHRQCQTLQRLERALEQHNS
jgi:Fungal Zn(2)-Cys(6) binuclear cluster domain/Fungal specific transcription factor domain